MVQERGNGGKGRNLKGVVQAFGSASIPKEFITPGADINAAIGKTIFRDETQKNAYLIYYSQLCMFFDEDDDEMVQFVYLLNMAPAIGGLNRDQSLEGHTGILRYLSEKENKNRRKIEENQHRASKVNDNASKDIES